MRSESKAAAAALETYFDNPANYAHASDIGALVLERLPSGDHAWLRPEAITDPDPDLALYWPTERGRELIGRWSAERSLFGREIS